jgi:hypothetical protein
MIVFRKTGSMKWFLLLFVISSALPSCRKGCSTGMGPKIQGTYSGTFIRWQGKDGVVSNVNISFTGNEFNGNSDSVNYPSICSGTFTTTNNPDSVHFINKCDFPANFDWSLVLTGPYKLVETGDSLYFRRVIGDFAYEEDVYSLRKQ